MSADRSTAGPESPGDETMADLANAFLAGDAPAGEDLFALLSRHARITARSFFGHEGPEVHDVAQDTALSVLEWLRRQEGFAGSLVNFTVAVARNRCRNHVVWTRRHPASCLDDFAAYLTDPQVGPLDTLLEAEREALAVEALASLDPGCRRLLDAIYREGRSPAALCDELGLKSFQAVYYRRAECLRKAGKFLKNRLFGCSSTEAGGPAGSRKTGNEETS